VNHAAEVLAAIDQLLEADRADRKNRALIPLERRVRRALSLTWAAQRRAALRTLAAYRRDFTEAIASDSLDQAIDTDGRVVAVLEATLEEALTIGVRHTYADVGIEGVFGGDFPEAIAYLEGRAANQVALFDEVTRRYLRTVLVTAGRENWSYQQTAKAITNRFIGFAAPVPQAHIRNRAELIAVTELGEAYEAGGRMIEGELVAAGHVLEKAWLVAGDERLCAICSGNAGAGWIAAGTSFPSGHEGPLGHPACRCATMRRTAKKPQASSGATQPPTPVGRHTPTPARPAGTGGTGASGGGRGRGSGGGSGGTSGWDPVPERWRRDVAAHQQPYVEAAARTRGMTVAEYDEALEAKMRDLLADAKPYMRVSERSLEKIVNDGRFKSQFETGTSSGALTPSRRAALEHDLFDLPHGLAPQDRPLYGYLGDEPLGNTDLNHYSDARGQIAVRFKDDVLDRTTFTFWDSLDIIDPPPAATGGPRMAPSTPANPRRGAVPHDAPAFVNGGAPVFQLQDVFDVDDLDEIWPYVEAQYHGGLTVDDIAEVVLEVDNPTLEAFLDAHGISWRYA